jgi:formimidoylglutamate deiminase
MPMNVPIASEHGDWRLPGIANLHSHAFQRAMAGMAERMTHPSDSFWTWRDTMYRMAARFAPDTLHAVAAQLYAEMLEAGYTTVCEFHYLHHAPDGRPYDDPAAMSRALIAAARETGIRLTLLPVLYMTGGFDGRPLNPRQHRFGHSVDAYWRLFDSLCREHSDTLRVGCALHSLRAVPHDAMTAVLAALPQDARIHIHIAEQIGEVQDCLAIRGERPMRWLLDHAEVDARWTLVHATHLEVDEVVGIADSGATVAICPTTEANLGDGLFPLRDYLDANGAWGIGSDSHSSVSPVEELRWLEYGQRLITRHRNIAATAASPSVGENLLCDVHASAAQATGFTAEILAGDTVTLNGHAPQLIGATAADVSDRWIFAGNRNAVDAVTVNGREVVTGGRHVDRDAITARFAVAMRGLLAG